MKFLSALQLPKICAAGLAALLVVVGHGQVAMAAGRLLNVDDVLQIKVVSQPDLDTTSRVETDGTINFPYAGRIHAAGRSQDSLAAIIEQKLKAADVVKDPHVLIELSNFGAQATVQGAVGAPGAFPLDRSTTLSQMLSRAGGVRENAGDIILRRPSKKGTIVLKYPSRDVVTGVIDANRIHVFNNDEIFVDSAPFYYLYGFVNKAGQYPLNRSLTVQQALAAAGGIAPLGSDWRINVKRMKNDGAFVEIPVSLDDYVQPNDTIVVNERIF